jgi:hypothetical protein
MRHDSLRAPRAAIQARRGGAAFGLIALLIVVVIGLMIYAAQTGSGGNYGSQMAQTRKQGVEVRNEIVTQQLSILISQYRQENNKLPKTPADLDNVAAFRDPWGKEMTFSFAESNAGTRVTYHSAGPDGEFNTEDDVKRTDTLQF